MKNIKKYLTIYQIFFRCSMSRDISFRMSFFASIIGAFCYVSLSLFIILFLMRNISFNNWGAKEMWVLTGCFFIVYYSIFFFFYRGFTRLIRNIHFGYLDFFLLRPVDSQFLTSSLSGGIHNLLAIIFGLFVTIWALFNLGVTPGILNIFLCCITLILSILDLYSLIFLLITLNFRFGYLEEVIRIVLNFQDVSRYPMEAFTRLPIFLLVVILPFSAISAIPAGVLIQKDPQWSQIAIFSFLSLIFIYIVRQIWFMALRSYTSSNV